MRAVSLLLKNEREPCEPRTASFVGATRSEKRGKKAPTGAHETSRLPRRLKSSRSFFSKGEATDSLTQAKLVEGV